jgi:hypothetical protein
MPAAPVTTLADLLLGLALASGDQAATNRVALEGLSFGRNKDGALELAVLDMEVAGLHGSFEMPSLTGDDAPVPDGPWSLAPLAAANGTLRAQIVDAHLVFDANVTVPIRDGQIRFNDATVEHVGPDSHMGVSRLGIYVDAPNGRSYLFQFATTPVAGVEFERRGSMLGAWVSDRGSLRLQEFAQGMLQQGPAGKGPGFTEQARLLFARTSLSGELRLGDGKVGLPGAQAELAGRAQGHNVVRLASESVGRGLTADVDSLSLRNLVLQSGDLRLTCDEIAGALRLRMAIDGAQLRFEFDFAKIRLSRLRLQCGAPASSGIRSP